MLGAEIILEFANPSNSDDAQQPLSSVSKSMLSHILDFERSHGTPVDAEEQGEEPNGSLFTGLMGAQFSLASLISKLGNYNESEQLMKRMLRYIQKRKGTTCSEWVEANFQLAECLFHKDQDEEAEELFQRGFDVAMEVHEWGDYETRRHQVFIGWLLERKGQYEEARILFEQELVYAKNTNGPYGLPVLQHMSYVAKNLSGRGKYAEAEQLCREILDIGATTLSQNRDSIPSIMDQPGHAIAMQGRREEAKEVFRQTYDLHKILEVEDHINTINSLSSLAQFMDDEPEEGVKILKRINARYQDMLGPENENISLNWAKIGQLYLGAGKLDEAEHALRQSTEMDIAIRGSRSPKLLLAMMNLAMVLIRKARIREARGVIEEIVRTKVACLGPEHPSTLESIESLQALAQQQQAWRDEGLMLPET
jgi:tetratricopeptide (TPR) repeat protein